MNLLKRFFRDNADVENEEYDDLYIDPEDIQVNMSDSEAGGDVASLNNPARKDPEIHPASPDKVSLKLLQPRTHTEATKIADKLKEGCIVLLDVSYLTKDQARRLVDFLAGAAYVMGGEMIKTNRNTIVVAPAGVDISGFAQTEAPAAEAAPVEQAAEEVVEDAPEEFEEMN